MGRKSDFTKARIADALEGLLEERPLSKITVSAVARAANTNRQTFYYHFDTLDDLVFYLCQQKMQLLSSEVAQCSTARELFTILVDRVDESRVVFKKVLNGMGRPALRHVFHNDAKAALALQARALAEARDATPSAKALDFAAEYCVLASASVLAGWIEGVVPLTADEVIETLTTAFEQQVAGLLLSCEGGCAG